jgi:Zn-dependent M28 family amino/carboxypeptidase
MTWIAALFLQAAPSAEALERHVRHLASDEFRGRAAGSLEAERAADYVAAAFKEAGLRPAGSDGWFHAFEQRGVRGRNVLGLRPGRLEGPMIVLAAHHDGLGVVEGTLRNGADDNASGVAVVLEAARLLSGSERPLLFVSFDAEERGLLGSREALRSGAIDASKVGAAVVLDLVGGRLFPWEERRVYALGSESSPAVDSAVSGAASGAAVDLRRLGVSILEPFPGMARSDYGPFRDRKVPFVFFSTGSPWYYHTEHDDAERLDYPKLARSADLAIRTVRALADGEADPAWAPIDAWTRTAEGAAESLKEIAAHREELGLGEDQVRELESLRAKAAETRDPAVLQRCSMKILTIVRSKKAP